MKEMATGLYMTYMVDSQGDPLSAGWSLEDKRKVIGVALILRENVPDGKCSFCETIYHKQ
jgi:hypothetical protein